MGWLALIILGLITIYYFMIWVMNRNKSIQNKDPMEPFNNTIKNYINIFDDIESQLRKLGTEYITL